MGLTNLTCLHVSNLEVSSSFYKRAFGFVEVSRKETPDYVASYIACDGDSSTDLTARQGVLELRQLKNEFPRLQNGNSAPYQGFGHLCVSVSNIAEAQKKLLEAGVNFKKKLQDGRQHNIAFVLDPDTYWIELIENLYQPNATSYDLKDNRFNHTMIRVKDPKISLAFYRGVLGMKLFSTRKFPDAKFTLYFVGYESDPSYVQDKETPGPQAGRESIIELTHNWGTESDDSFKGYYIFGKDKDVAGFDHFSVSTPDAKEIVVGPGKPYVVAQDGDYTILADPDGWKIQLSA